MKISKQQYAENGHTGLQNLGNTCFLNSCVQALVHTYEIHDLLNKQTINDRLNAGLKPQDARIFKEWKELTEVMWSGNGAVRPIKFVSAVQQVAHKKGVDIFTGWAQNDVTEFLRFIVNCFHTSIARGVKVNITGNPATETDRMAVKCYEMLNTSFSKEYSEIQDLFYGIIVSDISNIQTGKSQSLKPEQYFILDLPIPSSSNRGTTLYDCIDEFSKKELLTGDNQWYNETTRAKEDVHKQIRFWNFPKILVIMLKRFDGAGKKTNDLVDFPVSNLDLSKYVEDYSPKKYVYDLYGICNHMGSTDGGHYTAFVKNRMGKWLYCNDESVSVITNLTQMITPMAYCLFYRMK
jgi:ubiquitin carboxyl-terminal hydrolase 2/21